jgi:tetraacyldisaccharide 4'-kinase
MIDPIAIQRRMRPLLHLPSLGYGLALGLRRRAYERKLLGSYRSKVPVVSVGNIAWGGTGKTPLVDYLLSWAEAKGQKAAVLTRGYKAEPPGPHYVCQLEDSPRECGDEPLMLARKHPQASIIVDPLRKRSAAWAEASITPGIFLLDDGFQHLAVERDIDLVLLRPEDLSDQWNRIIPAGSWREDKGALGRASAFLIKSDEGGFKALEKDLRRRLERYGKPVFSFSLQPKGLLRVKDETMAEGLDGAPYVLVTAVGDPEGPRKTAEAFLGRPPEAVLGYPDHHDFQAADYEHIKEVLERRRVEHVVCTAKDAVKLGGFALENLWVLDVGVVFGRKLFSEASFVEWLESQLESL